MGHDAASLQLTGRQQALHDALAYKAAPELADMYLGAIHAPAHSANPEALPHAAQSLRELMEKIPEYVDIPVKAHQESMKSKVREVEQAWDRAQEASNCRDGARWRGNIDAPLERLLVRLGAFFDWFKTHHFRRRDEAAGLLRRIDASQLELPATLEDLNVKHCRTPDIDGS